MFMPTKREVLRSVFDLAVGREINFLKVIIP